MIPRRSERSEQAEERQNQLGYAGSTGCRHNPTKEYFEGVEEICKTSNF